LQEEKMQETFEHKRLNFIFPLQTYEVTVNGISILSKETKKVAT
jgi:hypothetical protein